MNIKKNWKGRKSQLETIFLHFMELKLPPKKEISHSLPRELNCKILFIRLDFVWNEREKENFIIIKNINTATNNKPHSEYNFLPPAN